MGYTILKKTNQANNDERYIDIIGYTAKSPDSMSGCNLVKIVEWTAWHNRKYTVGENKPNGNWKRGDDLGYAAPYEKLCEAKIPVYLYKIDRWGKRYFYTPKQTEVNLLLLKYEFEGQPFSLWAKDQWLDYAATERKKSEDGKYVVRLIKRQSEDIFD
ncbi:hypothetical protein TTRE_0000181401 [Trichuris trichiura]|uniref:Uncharacterized protein n=1 Tax=Trichuris trichiura TaxID=36087 RepID=A0A077Z0M1_TRITR|nr:hypothetical protein TTRE_0000181401 [Trichuris trichiura]